MIDSPAIELSAGKQCGLFLNQRWAASVALLAGGRRSSTGEGERALVAQPTPSGEDRFLALTAYS
jgi:hypothetical protein